MALWCCFNNSNSVSDVPGGERPPSGKPQRCTDGAFLGIFVVFWIGLIFIGTYALLVGNPLRMIHGSDSFGNVCGHTNTAVDQLPFAGLDLRHRPFLFHLNQGDPKNSIKICVRKCPRQGLTNLAEVYNFYTQTNSSLCRYDFDFTTSAPAAPVAGGSGGNPQTQPFVQDRTSGGWSNSFGQNNSTPESGVCPVLPVYPTRSLLYHCVPEVAITQGMALGHSLYDFISSYVPLNKVFSDIVNAHEEMAIMAAVALGSAIISAFVIHYVAYLASWLILLSISVLLFVLTGIFWWAYLDSRYRLETLPALLPEDYANESILLAVAIIATLFTIVILYAASTLRAHVRFVVALFAETASCIRAMPMLLAQPIWTLLSLLLMLIGWLILMMALSTASYQSREHRFLQPPQQQAQSSIGSLYRSTIGFGNGFGDSGSNPSPTPPGQSFTLINYERGELSWIHYLWWYLIIAFIWLSEFILSCQQMLIAGAVANWYFCRHRDRLERPIGRSFGQLVCCHLGSVALGSFLITLFKLPRLIIQQITSRLRQYNNRFAKTTLEACSCCLWLVERFLAYLSRNAYTVVAIEKTDFCPSARMAFQAMMSNALKVAAINSIGDFILFLGKLSVSAVTALVGVLLVRANPSLHYWMVPVLLMALVAFWIAHCLLSVYEMVIDAMFLCFCQDMNRHDGSPGNEYYAPDSLIRFLADDDADGQMMNDLNTRDPKGPGSESDYATVQ